MIIGINATAGLKQPRTGVEEYCYQIIKHLTMLPEAREHRFLLFVPDKAWRAKAGVPTGTNLANKANDSANDANRKFLPIPPLSKRGDYPLYKEGKGENYFDFFLPENFKIKQLRWHLPMWTQMRLASHLLFNKPDVLFIPVHILPLIHPKNSVVTIHGLEYEYFPQMYPFWFRNYLRLSTRYAVRKAKKIITVSENTRQDLIKIYGVAPEKVKLVYHGRETKNQFQFLNPPLPSPCRILSDRTICDRGLREAPFLLYLGRIELKKNILGILEAFKILKEKYKIPHQLILAGIPGFGYKIIKLKIETLRLRLGYSVRELGYVDERDKWEILAHAAVFLFPSFYEGFGLPILEAQAIGVPVVSSNVSSIPEIVGDSALLVNPENPEEIAQAVSQIIDDESLRDKLKKLGFENVKRFSWEKCAKETLQVIIEES